MTFLSDRVLDHLASVAPEPDLTGTRYRLIGPLGSGGMGAVYAAEDTVLGREVALKVTTVFGERLRREATVIARLEHPGIVPVHDMGTLADGSDYYVMKRLHGERLDRWIGVDRPLREVLEVFRRICEAVAFAHAHGVIHRDLKPENVMIARLGEVLVLDWGLAKAIGRDEHPEKESVTAAATITGTVMGTPGYMSPEQAGGDTASLDARSDVYALGAILQFLLSEQSAPKPLGSICAKAMARDRSERFASAEELALDVARYLGGGVPLSHRETWSERAARFVDRNKVVLWLLAAYLFVRLLLLAIA